jgi:hemerythrin
MAHQLERHRMMPFIQYAIPEGALVAAAQSLGADHFREEEPLMESPGHRAEGCIRPTCHRGLHERVLDSERSELHGTGETVKG